MKKIILISIFLIISVISFSQTEMKGRYNFKDTVRATKLVVNTIRSNDTNGIIIITDKYRHVIPFGAGQLVQENSKTGGLFGGAAMMLKYLAADTSLIGVGICLIPMGNMGGYDTMAFLGYVGKGGTKHYAVLVSKQGLILSSDTSQLVMYNNYVDISTRSGQNNGSRLNISPDSFTITASHIKQSVRKGNVELKTEIGDSVDFIKVKATGMTSGYFNYHDSIYSGFFVMMNSNDTITGIGYYNGKNNNLHGITIGKRSINIVSDSSTINMTDTSLVMNIGHSNNYTTLILMPNRAIISSKQKIDLSIRDKSGATNRSGLLLDTTSFNVTLDSGKREIYLNNSGFKVKYNNVSEIELDTHYFKSTAPIKVYKPPATIPSTVTDIDSNIYNTVTIGSQTWLASSLITTRYKNGDTIPLVSEANWGSDTIHGQYGVYSSLLGFEYNWAAVDSSAGLCPYGWHIPNQTEVDTLIDYLGGGLLAGGKLKDTSFSYSYWLTYPVITNGFYGFNMRGTGYRYGGSDILAAHLGYFWTSNEVDSVTGKLVEIRNGDLTIGYFDRPKVSGATVRCIMDTLPVYIDQSILTPNKLTTDTVNTKWINIALDSMWINSSDTITPIGTIFVVNGTDTVSYIKYPSAGYTGIITVLSDAGFSITDTGNINTGGGIVTLGTKRAYQFVCFGGVWSLIY